MYVMPSGSYTEFMAVCANIFFGMPTPLSSYLQVVFCVFNDVTMSISLMFEAPESDLMKRPPRNNRTQHITDWKFFLQLYGFTGLWTWLASFGMYFLCKFWF